MALVKILVDGYSLLNNWPEVAPGKPRNSASARDELIHLLTQYHDARDTPITVVFDGAVHPPREMVSPPASTPEVEVLYSKAGNKTEHVLERAAFRFRAHGEVLVVTNDPASCATAANSGATVSSCEDFIRTLKESLADLERDIDRLNQSENSRFRHAP